MMFYEYFRMAIKNLTHRRLRSWLTTIGIFIGITAVVAIISLGQGLGEAIDDSFQTLGTDKIFVSPGSSIISSSSSSSKLTESDLKVVRQVQGVDDVLGYSFTVGKVSFKDEDIFVTVVGIDFDTGEDLYREYWSKNLLKGRILSKSDDHKAFVGYDYSIPKKAFSKSLKVYDKLDINGYKFKIVGFQNKLGNSGDDQTVYISGDAFFSLFGKRVKDDYKMLMVRVNENADPSLVADRITKSLRDHRSLDEGDEDFTVQTADELLDSFGNILNIINVVIIGIAAISLLVGGVGITNTIYTSVVERTQEIGIMKAIGARNRDVMIIFLIESAFLGLAGGLLGIIFGYGLAYAVSYLGQNILNSLYLRAWWSWWLPAGSLLFSIAAGIIAGFMPARQASRQRPVDSLRYE